jgi:hypothetical protein
VNTTSIFINDHPGRLLRAETGDDYSILSELVDADCSGGGPEAPTPAASPTPSSSETTEQAQAVATPASTGSGFTWNDIPVYGGATQVQEMNWSIPPAEGDYTQVEWRYYETNDSLTSVSAFYKSNMPGNG